MATAIEEDKRAKRTGPAGFAPGVDVAAPLNLTAPGTMRPDAPTPVATQPAPQFTRTNAGPMLQTPAAPAPTAPAAPDPTQQRLANQTAMYVQGAKAAAAARPAPAPVAAGMNPAVGASINAAVANPQPSLGVAIDTSPRLFDPNTARPMANAAQAAPVAPVVAPAMPAPDPMAGQAAFVPPRMGNKAPTPMVAPSAGPVRVGDEGWRTKAVMDGAAQDAQTAWDRGEVGQAAGSVVRGAATAIPTAIYEAGEAVLSPVVGGARGFVRGLFGGEEAAPAAAPAPAAPARAPAAPSATAATKPPAAQAAKPTAAAPQSAKPAAPASANGFTEVAPGILRKGNTFTDAAGTTDAGFLNRGAITPQNRAAADGLAERYGAQAEAQARGFNPQQARQFDRAGSIRALNDLRSPEAIALRNLRISAEQEGEAARAAGRAWKGGTPAGDAYRALLAELTTGTREGQQAEMRNETELAATGMREAGATLRTGMNNAVSQDELGLKREAQGFTSRAAQRLEQAQQDYLNAKTPEEQAKAAKRIQAIQGKGDGTPTGKDRYITTGGGQEYDAEARTVVTRPQQVFDTVTGQPVGAAARSAAPLPPKSELEVGKEYQTKNGPAIWDGKNFVAQ